MSLPRIFTNRDLTEGLQLQLEEGPSRHLAGALRLPTLTIFTCTHVSAAGGYPSVRLATADVPCRPCGAVAHTCPIGHDACIVPRHADLAPKRLADAVMDLLRTRPTADQSPLAKMSDSR